MKIQWKNESNPDQTYIFAYIKGYTAIICNEKPSKKTSVYVENAKYKQVYYKLFKHKSMNQLKEISVQVILTDIQKGIKSLTKIYNDLKKSK